MAAGLDELVVRALLDDVPAVENGDSTRTADRRQSVGDHDRGAPGEQPPEPLLDPRLGVDVDVRRRLVEDQDPRVGDRGPREGHQLPLARR